MRPDGVTQGLRHQTKPSFVWFFKRLRCSMSCGEASSPAPQRESVEWSIIAHGAPLNVWARSHKFESVARITFAASIASGRNTRSAASCAWSLSRGFSTLGGKHICIQQTVLAAISWPSRQRARHTRDDLVLFTSRCLSLAGLDQQRNHDADHARNCQCRGYLHQWG